MSAATSEAGSEVGEVVTIHVKVEGSADEDINYDPSDDCEIFKSDCIVEIERKWLRSEFFEAPMKRWRFDENSQTRMTLFLPEGCSALEGARLLKLRLGSDYSRKRKNPISTPEERAWSPIDWWKATAGRTSSLFAALHLFDFTLQKEFAIEVVKTLELYRFRCPPWVVTIAQDLKVDVVKAKSQVEKLSVPFETFKKLLNNALTHDSKEHHRIMVERALAGSSYHPDDIMKALVEAWFTLFVWEINDQHVTDAQVAVRPCIGQLIRENKSLPWLHSVVEELVQNHPATACTCHTALFAGLKKKKCMYKVSRTNSTSGETSSTRGCASFAPSPSDRMRALCAHSLFVKSALGRSFPKVAIGEFCRVFCPATRYECVDGVAEAGLFIDPKVFAVAHPALQRSWLEASPQKTLTVFKDNVHLVHPSARQFLVEHASILSDKDMEFLTTATFSHDSSIEGGGASDPPQKKRKPNSS